MIMTRPGPSRARRPARQRQRRRLAAVRAARVRTRSALVLECDDHAAPAVGAETHVAPKGAPRGREDWMGRLLPAFEGATTSPPGSLGLMQGTVGAGKQTMQVAAMGGRREAG